MKLSEIANKPKLVKFVLDDENTVKEFGEPLEYWTYDRQPMDVFLRLSSINPDDQGEIINTVKDLILDEKGNKILGGDEVLPVAVFMRVMTQVVESLGKL